MPKPVETSHGVVKHPDVEVLLGRTSDSADNDLVIMTRVEKALRAAGHDARAYTQEAEKGTHEDLLNVTRSWVRTWEYTTDTVLA